MSFICNFVLTSYYTLKEKATIKRDIGFIQAFNKLPYTYRLFSRFVKIEIPEKLSPIFAITIPINILLVKFVFKSKNYNLIINYILFYITK